MGNETRDYRCQDCDTSHTLVVVKGEIAFCPDCDASLVFADGPKSASGPFARGKFLGRYEILGEIARGGMGVILKAHDSELNREIALKVLLAGEGATEDMIARLHREAQSASKLRHPGIVAVHDVGVEDSHHFIAMDYIDGGTLEGQDRRDIGGFEAVADLLADVAEAVEHAHAHDVIHRDLKPANILLDAEGRPHVTDFGIAKDLNAKGLTAGGAVLGTPEFMAPEQAQGMRNLDGRADVFALGVIGYTLATGKQPFRGRTIMESMKRVCETDPRMPSKLVRNFPADLEAVLLKAMEKNRAARYQSAGALADDLRRYVAGEPVSVSRPTIVAQAFRAAKRRWPILAGGGGALVAGIVIAIAFTGGDGGRAEKAEAREAQREARKATRDAEKQARQLETQRRKAELSSARSETVKRIEARKTALSGRHLRMKGSLIGAGKYDEAITELLDIQAELSELVSLCDRADAAEDVKRLLRKDADVLEAARPPGPLEQGIREDLGWAHALRGRNVHWFQRWDHPAAIRDLGEAMRRDPIRSQHRMSRGIVHLEARHFREAAEDLATVLPALPPSEQPGVRLGLIRAYCFAKDGPRAAALLQQLPADSVDREFFSAWLPYAQGRPADAAIALDDFLPNDWRGWQRKMGYGLLCMAALVRSLTASGNPSDALTRADEFERSVQQFARRGGRGGAANPVQKRATDLQMIELWIARALALETLARTGSVTDAKSRARADCERVRKIFAGEPESTALLARLK